MQSVLHRQTLKSKSCFSVFCSKTDTYPGHERSVNTTRRQPIKKKGTVQNKHFQQKLASLLDKRYSISTSVIFLLIVYSSLINNELGSRSGCMNTHKIYNYDTMYASKSSNRAMSLSLHLNGSTDSVSGGLDDHHCWKKRHKDKEPTH